MMKFGQWGALTSRFPGLLKLDANSHLFTSMWLYRGFPGKVSVIESIPDRSQLKAMRGEKINVSARNYPLQPAEIKKKYALKDGGSRQLYATRVAGVPVILIAAGV